MLHDGKRSAERLQRRRLLSLMHDLWDRTGGLSHKNLADLATKVAISNAEIFEFASFYPAFATDADRDFPRRLDLSCWLSCRPAGVLDADWDCVNRCAGRIEFEAEDVSSTAWSDVARLSAKQLLEVAQKSPRSLSLAKKWQRVVDRNERPILVVNADEGDPTSCKDRYLLETDPVGIVQASLLIADALRASELIFYVNCDYATALDRLKKVLRSRPVSFSDIAVSIERSGGAYICGEETALVASLEGYRGVPREKPYDLVASGLNGRPTLVHNVESLYRLLAPRRDVSSATAANALRDTRIDAISLTGRVVAPGVKLTDWQGGLRALIDECGGTSRGHALGGVVLGGMLGRVVTGSDLDLPRHALLDKVKLFGAGSIVVLSEADDPRLVLQRMLDFAAQESCGHCTPCRVGTSIAAKIFAMNGNQPIALNELALVMQDSSACGLGKGSGRLLEHAIASAEGADHGC